MKNNYHIVLADENNLKLNRLAIELAQIAMLFSDSMALPNVSKEKSPEAINLYLKDGLKNHIKRDGKNYEIIADNQDIIYEILENIFEIKKDSIDYEIGNSSNLKLEDIFGEGALKTRDKNYVINASQYSIEFRKDFSYEEIQAAAAVVSRIALDCQKIHYPITGDDANIIIKSNGKNRIENYKDKIKINCDISNMNDFYKLLEIHAQDELINYFNESLALKNFDGQYAYANSFYKDGEYYLEKISDIKKSKLMQNSRIKSYKDEKIIFEQFKEFEWEVDIFKREVLNVLENVNIDKKIYIEAILSEDEEIRKNTEIELKNILHERNIESEISILNSYKQGFSWIAEKLIPKIKKLNFDRIEILFSQFSKDPTEAWTEEEGAVPTYVNLNLDNEGKWFDLPIRLLQELYPIDDILAKELDFDRDKIEFKLLEEESEFKYVFKLWHENKPIETFEFLPKFSERYYLDEFPTMGLVHPNTAYFKIVQDDKLIAEKFFKTDLENIWNYYQKEILPKAMENVDSFHEPIFSKLKLEINLSECDYKLPIREDRISALDSFHEDLYFVGLDYFKLASQKRFGKIMDAPGLILPIIHKTEGRPNIRWSISVPIDRRPFVLNGDKKYYIESKIANSKFESIEIIEGKKLATISLNGENIAAGLKQLIEKNLANIPKSIYDFDKLILNADKVYCIDIKRPKKTENILQFEHRKDKIYNYEDTISAIDNLNNTGGIETEYLSSSYEGRKIHSIYFDEPSKGFKTSYKKTYTKPTIYINARHHANEVSSTNSTFDLIKKLGTIEIYKKYLDRMNIIFLPNENPDGTDIHYELQKEHPEWIFHISRFNALGKEFGHDYFVKDTIHTEAKALEKIYKKWLPDIFIDDHGVPHHEWSQQFSGYTAPAYKGFWLPRALLYGYFWYREGFEKNISYAKELEHAIAKSFRDDEESTKLNEDLKDRFFKYANNWLPKMFPANYYMDLIFYWIAFDEKSTKNYLSVRFPEITVVGYTSEVTDETATSKHLKMCSDAHVKNNLAILETVYNRPIKFQKNFMEFKNGLLIENKRIRN
ncbi:MAG: M14 family metallopeptidase [Tissierellia bacterium]|nr:M14 family metallopeptidase [Tissierellia bacterium]